MVKKDSAHILITLPSELLKEVDRYCRSVHMNRSEYVRGLMRTNFDPFSTPIVGYPIGSEKAMHVGKR